MNLSCSIFFLFTGLQGSFLDPGNSLFSSQPLSLISYFLICSAGASQPRSQGLVPILSAQDRDKALGTRLGASLIVQPLHTSFLTVLLPG